MQTQLVEFVVVGDFVRSYRLCIDCARPAWGHTQTVARSIMSDCGRTKVGFGQEPVLPARGPDLCGPELVSRICSRFRHSVPSHHKGPLPSHPLPIKALRGRRLPRGRVGKGGRSVGRPRGRSVGRSGSRGGLAVGRSVERLAGMAVGRTDGRSDGLSDGRSGGRADLRRLSQGMIEPPPPSSLCDLVSPTTSVEPRRLSQRLAPPHTHTTAHFAPLQHRSVELGGRIGPQRIGVERWRGVGGCCCAHPHRVVGLRASAVATDRPTDRATLPLCSRDVQLVWRVSGRSGGLGGRRSAERTSPAPAGREACDRPLAAAMQASRSEGSALPSSPRRRPQAVGAYGGVGGRSEGCSMDGPKSGSGVARSLGRNWVLSDWGSGLVCL